MGKGCKAVFTGCLSIFIVIFLFFVGACVRINSEDVMKEHLKKWGILIKKSTIDLETFYIIGSGPSQVTYMWLYPPIKNKSKYISLNLNLKILVPTTSFGYGLSGVTILEKGYGFYSFSDLIFNKEKKNDFGGIEKVLDKYSEYYTIDVRFHIENYGYLKKLYSKNGEYFQFFRENGELVFKKVSMTYEEFKEKEEENREKYYELYDEYFKEPRQFETMNWDEFGEKLSYFPVLNVVLKCKECDLSNKEEREKEIYDRLKKYHNPKTYKLEVYVEKEEERKK